MNLQALKDIFPADDLDVRVGPTNKDKTKGMALAYLTSRAVMDRLDDIVGPENWMDAYTPGPNGGVVCGISIKTDTGEWVTKWDGADNSDMEGVKGGLSDSFKRAGVKWGIGRYLYKLPPLWVPITVYGKTAKITNEIAAKQQIEKSSRGLGLDIATSTTEPAETTFDDLPPAPRQPAPKAEPKPAAKPQRPYDPATLRAGIAKKAIKSSGVASDKQRIAARLAVMALVLDDDAQYRTVLAELFGKDSSAELTAGQCSALIKWAGTADNEDHQPNPDAIQECAALIRQSQIDAGQASLI